jgi:preprotein translocase subunit SecA
LSCQLEPKDFRGLDPETAGFYARDLAEREAETQIIDAVDENLPPEEEESEWKYEALAKWSNTRSGTNFNASALKKVERDRIDEAIFEKSREFIANIDLSEGVTYLAEDYGLKMLTTWMQIKFGVEMDPAQLKELESPAIKEILMEAAENAYRQREAQFPVLASFARYRQEVAPGQIHIDGGAIAQHSAQRFEDPSAMEIQNMNGEQAFAHLVKVSNEAMKRADSIASTAAEKVEKLYSGESAERPFGKLGNSAATNELVQWLKERLNWSGKTDDLKQLDRSGLEQIVQQIVEDRFCPEIRRMERTVLLRIVDDTWMAHLLAMDHLRSAVSFRGFAQMDPKVEYKREGMKLFEQMWFSIGERMTDIIFRMEALDDGLVASSFVETQARHDAPPEILTGDGGISPEQRAAMEAANAAGREASKPEPIRRQGERIGRNDPCTCGSGKKYKNCCMRRQI